MAEQEKTHQSDAARTGKPEVTPTEARQSEKGRGLIYVLAGALVLAIVVWAVLELLAPNASSPGVNTVDADAEQVAPATQ